MGVTKTAVTPTMPFLEGELAFGTTPITNVESQF